MVHDINCIYAEIIENYDTLMPIIITLTAQAHSINYCITEATDIWE